ncbi:MAG: helix-turn-helix domain-containing protein [Allosphingosinicella sp.]|uniref:helix-turn-helix domain-containing protein n=1 Tax=Allosphingosinicella sp. TaxID=2823234 RepID=UPI00395F151E
MHMQCILSGDAYSNLTDLRRIVKKDSSKAMSFGGRLAEERKRLGLKQAEFAQLVGTDVPKQSLYENDKRELRADYLARVAEAEVDVVYVLTGRRGEGLRLGDRASELLSAYLTLPGEMQQIVEELALRLRDQFTRGSGQTLHARRLDYRPDERG